MKIRLVDSRQTVLGRIAPLLRRMAPAMGLAFALAAAPSEAVADEAPASQPSVATAELTEIVFQVGPPTVAPQYRRTKTWTLTPSTLRFHVTNTQNETVRDETMPIDAAHWARVVDALDTAGMRIGTPVPDNQGCTGGTTRSLTVRAGEEVRMDGTTYFCAGTSYGPLFGDHQAFLAAIQEGVDPVFFEHE